MDEPISNDSEDLKKNDRFESFEEALPELDKLLLKNKYKWQLQAIPSWSFDDVSQIVRLHVFNKWHLYDKTQNFSPWANTIIGNQIRNIQRNIFSAHSRPCLKCVYNMGGDACEWTNSSKQCSECPLYKKWENGKKYAHDLKIPVSMENHLNEVSEIHHNEINVEKAMPIIHKQIKSKLKPNEYKVYECLFIKNMSNEDTAVFMGYSCKEQNRQNGYGRISQIRRIIIKKVKEIMSEIDLF